jgi:hypothetical protein
VRPVVVNSLPPRRIIARMAHESSAGLAYESRAELREQRSVRSFALAALGPATVVVGVAWALLQPWRITLLHPHGQGFWWLLAEPPLLVALAGAAFALVVAPGLLSDLGDT